MHQDNCATELLRYVASDDWYMGVMQLERAQLVADFLKQKRELSNFAYLGVVFESSYSFCGMRETKGKPYFSGVHLETKPPPSLGQTWGLS